MPGPGPPAKKSRAEEARKRRRRRKEREKVLREARARTADVSSSDEQVCPRPAEGPAHSTSAPIAAEGPGRFITGRRLLYGAPSTFVANLSGADTPDEGSFTDGSGPSGRIALHTLHTDTESSLLDNDPQTTSEDSSRVLSGEDNAVPPREASAGSTSSPSEASNSNEDEAVTSIKEDVAGFVMRHSLTVSATRELLSIFRKAGVTELPRDRRTLLKTPRTVDGIVEKCGGQFKYLGIESGLEDYLKQHPDVARVEDNLPISVSVDGLPLHKSTKSQFWPILCKVGSGDPFLVALYQGYTKPTDVDEFLEDFLEEYQHLAADGMLFNGKRYTVQIRSWICDAPARSFLKCIKGHTGYFACERCKVKGFHEHRRVLYPVDGVYAERTDADFAAMAYDRAEDGDNHQNPHQSPLIGAGLNCVSGVVIDIMHNVYLGAWKRFLHFIFSGPRAACRLSNAQKNQLDMRFLGLRLPSEFSRQPRTIFQLDYWKATEYRSSLLYTGIVFLRGIVSEEIYSLYLKLCAAMNILHTENDARRNAYLPYARELLLEFIRDSQHLLGPTYVVYNIHNVAHVPDDVEQFQCSVNHLSAFPFENHLQGLKKLVKGPHNPIGQVFSRLAERRYQNFFKPGKLIKPYISTRSQDSMFFLNNTMEFAMIQRRRRQDGRYDVLLFAARITHNFFVEPCESKMLGIYLVKNMDHVEARPRIVVKDDLSHKVVLMGLENGRDYVLIPMLHDAEI